MLHCSSRGSLASLPKAHRLKLYSLSNTTGLCSAASARRHVHSKPVGTSPEIDALSEEQKDVLARALEGENIFITGPSGSGKSHLLKIIAKQLVAQKRPFLLTGGTPLSAFNIQGTPLHLFTEGQTVKQLEDLQHRRRKDPGSIEYRAKWRRLKTLIIDDISQIDALLFTALEKLARKIRGQTEPFGGVQIIASGDFFQLPPESMDAPAPDYVFNARYWEPTFSKSEVELSQVYSQSEPEFITMLNQARVGKLSPQSDDLLASLARPILAPSIELCPLHVQVNALVSSHLKSLRGPLVEFKSRHKWFTPEGETVFRKLTDREKEVYDTIAPDILELKVGAQVMCIQDFQIGAMRLPKSTLGTVTTFLTPHEAMMSKVPFLQKGFQSDRPWPVVMFENGKKVLLTPIQFRFSGSNGTVHVHCSRTQLPLKLAAAGLVHEFRSSNISRVKIDLSKRFPQGLAYSALSRARSLDGLEVSNYLLGSIVPPTSVVAWYKKQPWARFLS